MSEEKIMMPEYEVEVETSSGQSMIVSTPNGDMEFEHQLNMSSPGDVITLYRLDDLGGRVHVRESYG